MKCSKCGLNMKSEGTIDDNWRMYRCQCGYEAAKHIYHSKRRVRRIKPSPKHHKSGAMK